MNVVRLFTLMSLGLAPWLLHAAEQDLAAHLLQRYYAFIEATTNGNQEMAEQVLSARNIQATINALANSGRLLTPESFRSSRPRPRYSVDDIEFVIVNGPTAGLALKSNDVPAELTQAGSSDTDDAAFMFIRFVMEGGVWKYDAAVTRYEPALTGQGLESSFDRSWITDELVIDGVIRPAPAPVPVVNPTLVGRISNTCNACKLEMKVNGIVQNFSVPFIEGGLKEGENNIVLTLEKPPEMASTSGRLTFNRLVQDGQFGSSNMVYAINIGELDSGSYEFTFVLTPNEED